MSRTRNLGNSAKGKSAPTQWKERLLPDDYEELRQTFDVFDEDGSGTIDPVEISKALADMGV